MRGELSLDPRLVRAAAAARGAPGGEQKRSARFRSRFRLAQTAIRRRKIAFRFSAKRSPLEAFYRLSARYM